MASPYRADRANPDSADAVTASNAAITICHFMPWAIVVGCVAGGFTLVVGQYAFSIARPPLVRLVLGLLFALPAARAGYDATLALAHIGAPSEWWRVSFAMLGAIAIGSTTWARPSM
jgi:hypothetical protein